MMTVIAVVPYEGGPFIPWPIWIKQKVESEAGKLVHAIVYSDGSIWDAYSGWRKEA